MDAHHTVVDLSPVAIVPPTDAHGLLAAFCCARFVHAADRLRVGMVPGDDPLAAISQLFFIPLDRFEKAL